MSPATAAAGVHVSRAMQLLDRLHAELSHAHDALPDSPVRDVARLACIDAGELTKRLDYLAARLGET